MIYETDYSTYFEKLATLHTAIRHNADDRQSFFFIEQPDDTEEFDNALRNYATSPALLAVAEQGELNDNNSENHTEQFEGQLYVIARKEDGQSIKQVRDICKPIVMDILAKMKIDAKRTGGIIPGKLVQFRINNISYQKVGPMNISWYGYTFWFNFTCPFGFAVTSGSWSNIQQPGALPLGLPGQL
jgi:hypothetical protein